MGNGIRDVGLGEHHVVSVHYKFVSLFAYRLLWSNLGEV